MNVVIGATPTLSVNSPSICEGESITLTATPSAGGGVYLWGPGGETSSSISVSPTTTPNYTVSYSLNGCTSAVQTSTVTVNPSPTVSVNSGTICQGANITLSATPSSIGGSYSWSPGGATSSSITVSPSGNTNYTVIYSLNGCPSNTAT